ncbi:carbohydrate ABC transporter permease [Lachnospiraceae bacterium OttesenSCG-928-D06]|nr:carbohydrate ABC transporter permease [Lachnospiraceae bacterium OttesenSCG-928-D06]
MKEKRFKPSQVLIYLVLSLWAATTIYPILWVIQNSFKIKNEILSNSFSLPLGDLFTMANYRTAFDRVPILNAYKNSLIISISVSVFVIIFAGMASYGLVRYTFKGKKILNSLLIAGMMFPVFSTIIPVFRMELAWGIAGKDSLMLSLIATILPQIAGNLSFAIVVLSGYIRGLPIELEEAAFLEGCRAYEIFVKIIVPITKPSFATVAIFTFLWSYNDLFTQSFFLRTKNKWTITMLLNQLTALEGTNYGLMAAAVTLVVVPVIVVYIFLQKYIIKGMTAGAIKG